MKTCGNKKVKNEKWMRKEWWNELERCDEKAWNKDAWNEEVKLLQVKVERRSLRQCKKATRLSQQTLGSVTTLQAKRRKAQQSRRYAGRQTITQMKTDRMKGRTKHTNGVTEEHIYRQTRMTKGRRKALTDGQGTLINIEVCIASGTVRRILNSRSTVRFHGCVA